MFVQRAGKQYNIPASLFFRIKRALEGLAKGSRKEKAKNTRLRFNPKNVSKICQNGG